MPSGLEHRLRRSQLFAAVQLAALATVPFVEPSDGSALWQIVFVAAFLLTLAAVALLLSPTANQAVGQSAGPSPGLPGRYVSAGRVALSLATACTAFLLLDYGAAALFGSGRPGPATHRTEAHVHVGADPETAAELWHWLIADWP